MKIFSFFLALLFIIKLRFHRNKNIYDYYLFDWITYQTLISNNYLYFVDDETSSVTSTDSGTSQSKTHKLLVRERLSLNNTPDIEPDVDNASNNDDDNQTKTKFNNLTVTSPEESDLKSLVSPVDTNALDHSYSCKSEIEFKEELTDLEESFTTNASLINDEKLTKIKPGPLSKKIKQISAELNGSRQSGTLTIVHDLEKLNAISKSNKDEKLTTDENQKMQTDFMVVEESSHSEEKDSSVLPSKTIEQSNSPNKNNDETLEMDDLSTSVDNDDPFSPTQSATPLSPTQESAIPPFSQESATPLSPTQESAIPPSTEESSTSPSTQESATPLSPTQQSASPLSPIYESATPLSPTQKSAILLSPTKEPVTPLSSNEKPASPLPLTEESSILPSRTEQSTVPVFGGFSSSERTLQSQISLSSETRNILDKLPLSNSVSLTSSTILTKSGDNQLLGDEIGHMQLSEKEHSKERAEKQLGDEEKSLTETIEAEKLLSKSSSVTIKNISNCSASEVLNTNATSKIETKENNSKSTLDSEASILDYTKLLQQNGGITISSKSNEANKSENNEEGKISTPDSLLEAVRLVQNIGNIAIKRLDNNTMEHTSGNDKITISVAEKNSEEKFHKISSEGEAKAVISSSSISVTKASEKEKQSNSGPESIKMNPSISIIPMSNTSSDIHKHSKSSKLTSPPRVSSCPSQPSTPSSVPPPPLLTPTLPSPSNVRPIFSPHLPGLQMQGGSTKAPITSPGLRMIASTPPAILMGGARMPVRHLPPDAGPLSLELHKHSQKLAEMMRNSLEEVLAGLISLGTPEARLAALQLELERCNWRHQQEVIEIRHNADVMLVEMRANMDAEKQRAVEEAHRQLKLKLEEFRRQMEIQVAEKVAEVKRQMEIEKQRAVEETKKKQWCANCGKEALFFCCWNTSYCDYPCQVVFVSLSNFYLFLIVQGNKFN